MIYTSLGVLVSNRHWYIDFYIQEHENESDIMIQALRDAGINEENLRVAESNLLSGNVNNGITFSNPHNRKSVSIIGITISPESFIGLLAHELHHLSVQIATSNGLDLEGEDVCYINGDIAQYLYPLCRPLIT